MFFVFIVFFAGEVDVGWSLLGKFVLVVLCSGGLCWLIYDYMYFCVATLTEVG